MKLVAAISQPHLTLITRPLPSGYISTERISNSPYFRGVSGAIGEKIFRYLCERAVFKEIATEVYGSGVYIKLKPGQLWTRCRQIEKDTGISRTMASLWLRRLEGLGLISRTVFQGTQKGTGFTVVTILKHLLSPSVEPEPQAPYFEQAGCHEKNTEEPNLCEGINDHKFDPPPVRGDGRPLSAGTDEKNSCIKRTSSRTSPELGEGEDIDLGISQEDGESRFEFFERYLRFRQSQDSSLHPAPRGEAANEKQRLLPLSVATESGTPPCPRGRKVPTIRNKFFVPSYRILRGDGQSQIPGILVNPKANSPKLIRDITERQL